MTETSRLAECAVEGGIKRMDGEAQLRGGDPVVSQPLIASAVLLVGIDILEAGRVRHFLEEDRTPFDEVCGLSDWSVYWYRALLPRPPMRISWAG